MVLMAVATIPFLVRGAQIYVVTRLADQLQLPKPALSKLNVDPGFFEGFLRHQSFFVMILVIFAGAGLISKDKKFGAFQIYFSKPVSWADYVAGKAGVIAFYTGLVTFVPAVVLFVLKALMSADSAFLAEYYWIPFSAAAHFAIVVLTYGGLILALSSLGKGARFAGIGFFAILGLTGLAKEILSSVPEAGAVSIGFDIEQITRYLFGRPLSSGVPVWIAALVLAGVVATSLLVLRRQVKGTEVVQ